MHLKPRYYCTRAFAWLVAAALFAAVAAPAQAQFIAPSGLDRIDRIVVVYLENRSFNNLFGLFPGANGLAQARPEIVPLVVVYERKFAQVSGGLAGDVRRPRRAA